VFVIASRTCSSQNQLINNDPKKILLDAFCCTKVVPQVQSIHLCREISEGTTTPLGTRQEIIFLFGVENDPLVPAVLQVDTFFSKESAFDFF
jgi:hypothetical protein